MESTVQQNHTDDIFDEVFLAMQDGDNQTALKLLSQIQTEDEVQRQMVADYQMQLSALLEMEQAELNDVPSGLIAGDDEEEDAVLSWDDDEPAVDEDAITTVVEEVPVGVEDELVSTVAKETAVSPLADDVLMTEEVSAADATLEKLPSDAFIYTHHIDPSLSFMHSQQPDLNEADLALQQVGKLLDDSEYETASSVLQIVLQSGDAEQLAQAKVYNARIEQALLETAPTTVTEAINPVDEVSTDDALATINDEIHSLNSSNEPDVINAIKESGKTGAGDSLIENIFSDDFAKDDTVVDFAEHTVVSVAHDAASEEADAMAQVSLDVDPEKIKVIEPVSDMPVADAAEAVSEPKPDEEQAVIQSHVADSIVSVVSDIASVTEPVEATPTTSDMTQPSDAASVDSEQDIEETIITTPTPIEVSEPIVKETFTENEVTENLLPPTRALQGFSFSAEDLFNQTKETAQVEQFESRQGFLVGDVRLMINFADGSELTDMPEYFRVPNAPSWLIGLTNMHGIVIPIFDLVQFLNLKDNPEKGKSMMLVIQHDEKAVGIIINGLPRRLTWGEKNRVDANTSPPSLRAHVNTACLIDDNLWFDLNTESLCQLLEKSL